MNTASEIAQVAVDVPLAHLDSFFDYLIPPELDAAARVGTRVEVVFAGKRRFGFIVARRSETDYSGRLAPLRRVISAEVVLSSDQVQLIRAVADHYAGTFADVMRFAVPPRHGPTERASERIWPAPRLDATPTGGLLDYPHGKEWLDLLASGGVRRVCWQVDPAYRCTVAADQLPQASTPLPDDWTRGVVQATSATLTSGRSVVVVVPDAAAVQHCKTALETSLGAHTVAELTSDAGPARRYRNYLALARGSTQVVVGTRSAGLAPLANLGLIVVVDDGDDLLAEQRAPYPHARDVAALRASLQHTNLLFVSYARSTEVQRWVESRWLAPIETPRAVARRRAPAIHVSADSDLALARDPLARAARLPDSAFETIRNGLSGGPVLVQVPRAGYLMSLTCATCRTPLRCHSCQGPVELDANQQLKCRLCGALLGGWVCPACGGRHYRAPVVGARRTAEELGRAFPGVRVVDAAARESPDPLPDEPALVIATPGTEPRAAFGYSAAVLLDAALLLRRADLRADEEALRRWLGAVALVRPGADGGQVLLVGPSDAGAVQALVRLDPGGLAGQALAERRAAGFPPAWTFITLEGPSAAVVELLESIELPSAVERLGPVPFSATPDWMPPTVAPETEVLVRAILRTQRSGTELAKAVHAGLALRSAKKRPGWVRVRRDPVAIE